MGAPLVSEDHILSRIDRFFPESSACPGVRLGRGDDCAVLDGDGLLCVSTDLFMEGAHFRRAYFSPEDIGWKALAVNLSDLAGMGAVPVGFTAAISLPPDADTDLVDGLCRGMADLASLSRFGGFSPVPLVGGDLSRADRLHLCLTVFGRTHRPLTRGGAMPGDVIFMVGRAGLARAGLLALEAALTAAPDPALRPAADAAGGTGTAAGGPAAAPAHLADTVAAVYPEAVAAHLRPLPRLAEGTRLSALAAALERERGERVRLGLMDLSDGLARDLPRLLGPGNGAEIRLPLMHPEITRFLLQDEQAGRPDRPERPERPDRADGPGEAGEADQTAPADRAERQARAARHVWLGGEDYGLIGFCEPRFAAQVMVNAAEAVMLGHVAGDGRFVCNGLDCGSAFGPGFDHFGAA